MVLVLKEQNHDRVPPSGLRILQSVEKECVKVQSAVSKYLRRHVVIKMTYIRSTVVRIPPYACALRICLRRGPSLVPFSRHVLASCAARIDPFGTVLR